MTRNSDKTTALNGVRCIGYDVYHWFGHRARSLSHYIPSIGIQ